MRLVARTGPGSVEVAYMWLPTWIGMNQALVRELDAHLGGLFVGQELSEDLLDRAHNEVLNFLEKRFNITGLFEYLDAVKYVSTNVAERQGRPNPPPDGQQVGGEHP